jgi:hypothetical protein
MHSSIRIHCSLLVLLLPVAGLAYSDQRTSCINNLRDIDGTKEELALEQKLKPGDPIQADMLQSYFHGKGMPSCPAGGDYTIGPVGVFPTCSIPSHSVAAINRDMARQAALERFLLCLSIVIGGVIAIWTVLSTLANRRRGT